MTQEQRTEIAHKNPITLAFVGDAFMTLHVRTGLVMNNNLKPVKLHDMTSKVVCAKAQAKLFDGIQDALSETEKDIANRARNAGVNTIPSSCTLAEYKKATAFEAVLGYNVLIGELERAKELLSL